MTADRRTPQAAINAIGRALGYELDALDTYDLSDPTPADYEDTTIGDVRESIETNMWLAEAYAAQGAEHLARECAKAAWNEYSRFEELLTIYYGPKFGEQVRAFLLAHFPDVIGGAK